MRRRKKIHPESLLHVPLVRQFVDDPTVGVCIRGVDQRWVYNDYLKASMGGFNPYTSRVYAPAYSALAAFLSKPERSARELNVADRLVNELLFAVHDYLHVWTFHAIHELAPEIGFGRMPITDENFETFVFCHLLTEVAATVGVDYWYLSTVNLNHVCDIGTALINRGLTTSYHESNAAEFRRFDPTLDVQSVDFFAVMTVFYCTGEFPGFGTEDLQKSPLLLAWLRHELRYGAKQRLYTRQLLASLAGGTREAHDREVGIEDDWQSDLVERLGMLLWRKVKNDELLSFAAPAGKPWASEPAGVPDYGFTNFCRLTKPPVSVGKHFLNQLMMSVDFARASEEFKQLVHLADPMESRQLTFVLRAMEKEPRMKPNPDEPLNLMLVN